MLLCFEVLVCLSLYVCRLVEVEISGGNLFQVTELSTAVECILGTIRGKKSLFKLFTMLMDPT